MASKGKARISKMKQKKNVYEVAWYILPAAGLLIWGALSVSRNLWYDELYSASLITNKFWDMLRITAVDAHSPFYYTGLKIFYYIFGQQIWALKLFSLIFMTGYLLLGMFPVKRLFGLKVSVYFMFFSITMPIMSVQGGNVRMYAMALFFMTWMSLTAYDIYVQATRKKWVIFCLTAVCSVYCHTFAMIQSVFLFIIFLAALVKTKQFQKLKGFFISAAVVSLCYLPWLIVTFYQMQRRIQVNGGALGDSSRPNLYTFMDYCKEWFSALETPIAPVVFLGMGLAVFLGYYGTDYMRSCRKYAPGLGVLAIGLTSLTGVLVSYYINPCFLGRYAFPGFGALMLLYAVGMEQINSRKLKSAVVVTALVCFVLQYRSELSLEYDPGLNIYEEFYAENVGKEDVILTSQAHTAMLSVYHPEQKHFIYGYKSANLPFLNVEAYTELSQLMDVDGNIWFLCFSPDEPDEMAEHFTYELVLDFHYMYYDFSVFRLEAL